MDSSLVQLTGLWVQQGRKGDFLSGTVGRVNYLVFKNNRKQKDSDPDYYLCLAPSRPKDREKCDDNEPGWEG